MHPSCRECVAHRTYEVHAAAMYPIRVELGLVPPAVAGARTRRRSASALEPEEEPGMLRRLLKRWRGSVGDGSGPPSSN